MFHYQKTNRYFAQLADDLETLGKQEMASFDLTDLQAAYRGIYFTAEQSALYEFVYCSRLFTRVLAPLLRFDCHSAKYLYRTAGNISWTDLFSVSDTFAITATVSHSKIRHSQYAALRLKDAIVDQFNDKFGKRPTVDTKNPDMRLNLHIENNKATIALDLSGGSLHRRGYRQESVEAPMQETVAAAIIQMINWQGEQPLVDIMCGSGTILAEALMHYCKVPAGFLRSSFGFSFLPDFNRKQWEQTKSKITKSIRPLPENTISGSDVSPQAISASKTNMRQLPHGEKIELTQRSFQDIPIIKNSIIVSNPPYGLRMNRGQDMKQFYKSLGDFLKKNCTGSTAYLYFGKREMIKHIGLRATWKKPLTNGGLDGRLVKYELY